jgi:phage terminase large subunit GpA-like protein
LIADSAVLRERVKPARSRDAGNTVLTKEFPAGLLVITGANSAVGLRSMPARYLFLDEVDAYPPSADEEGDPVAPLNSSTTSTGAASEAAPYAEDAKLRATVRTMMGMLRMTMSSPVDGAASYGEGVRYGGAEQQFRLGRIYSALHRSRRLSR